MCAFFVIIELVDRSRFRFRSWLAHGVLVDLVCGTEFIAKGLQNLVADVHCGMCVIG